ncbi:MAG: 16S rRNA (cytosine(1402)-N(4))-methyltransferase RsmH [Flavobacteriales bacterium]|nr:16S rRNA (cytosine(1402)-N(4))-methyltransferase RsmH [Flavobacteriales bacterium]
MRVYHNPVLLHESIDGLALKPNGVYVDVTFGGGGHSKEILTRLGSDGKLIAFDQDPDAKANAMDDKRLTLVDQNFRYIKNWLRLLSHRKVDGILADLGVSSHQFDSAERGFSTRFDSALDMRMDQQRKLTAHHVVNEYDEEKLLSVLREYGELKNAKAVARKIIGARPIETSMQLKTLLDPMAQRGKEHKFHAQVFQALRIEVNEELEALKELLKQSIELLNTGGRLVVISYHSLEDRLVKNFMRTGNFEGKPQKDFFGNLERPLTPLHTKPIAPKEEEIEENNRARSAHLRIAEKT